MATTCLMTLEQYLRQNNRTPSAFAAEIDVAASTITRLLARERSPNLDLLKRIKDGTGGMVTPNDFLDEIESAP